jgi:hypothetical protein
MIVKMIDLQSRHMSDDDVYANMKQMEKISEKEQELLCNAIMVFFKVFQMDPNKYYFDYRFDRK